MNGLPLHQLCDQAFDAIGSGAEEQWIARLLGMADQPDATAYPRYWQALGLLHRAIDDGNEALVAMQRAKSLAPNDPSIINGLAQIEIEIGKDAVDTFDGLLKIAPSAQAMQGYAAALVQSGDTPAALAFLDRALDANPAWGEGHWLASRLRWQQGERGSYLESLDRALHRDPRNVALWQLRLSIQFRATFFTDAIETIARARRALGDQLFLRESEAIALSESGSPTRADPVFAALSPASDLTGLLYRMRHALRMARPEQCCDMAAPVLSTDAAIYAWSYVSLAWRMLNDPRSEWLEGQPGLVSTHDLGGGLPMAQLRQTIGSMHATAAHPLEQSVRGGTQTDGALFSRPEAPIRALRAAVLDAYRQHIAALPESTMPNAGFAHPQLDVRRDRPLRFAAAWSIRLDQKGRHVSHIHPYGWFSSAFYVAVPTAQERGPAPAGWLVLGEPEEGLNLGLSSLNAIEPKEGRLVIFPSTMWHGTRAFGSGLRMSVAFDIARPTV
ncbi:tetratricopeptide repeat protein [Novosphingobium sp. ERN07]|uniref:putative 2OG-Fe(II) oxygenase n=1 Tax=Novosphingobium sp. ERN07 TaxID=2726187 RepID=UPI001456B28D|nr:putative 2OG-Fe(II) oxygenase [Novosphingobium sp. ERN07]NLR69720.1 tetratricopeptide repeat protein [Novosphingobium sp. ERN07]